MSTSDPNHQFESRVAQAIAAGLRVAADMIDEAADEVDEPFPWPSPMVRGAASAAAHVLERIEKTDELLEEPPIGEEIAPVVAPAQPVEAAASDASTPVKSKKFEIKFVRLRAVTELSEFELRRLATMSDDEFQEAQRVGVTNYLRGAVETHDQKIAGFAAEAAE